MVGTIKIEANRAERNRIVAEKNAYLEAGDYDRARPLNKKLSLLFV